MERDALLIRGGEERLFRSGNDFDEENLFTKTIQTNGEAGCLEDFVHVRILLLCVIIRVCIRFSGIGIIRIV